MKISWQNIKIQQNYGLIPTFHLTTSPLEKAKRKLFGKELPKSSKNLPLYRTILLPQTYSKELWETAIFSAQ
jgi:hypothetical protein